MKKHLKTGGILGIISGSLLTLLALASLATIEEQVYQYPIPNVNSLLDRIFDIAIIALGLAILYYCTKVFEQIKKDKHISQLSTVFLMVNGVMLLIADTDALNAGIPGAIAFFALLFLVSGILGIIGGVMYLINLKNIL